jgi:hypothetical protein
VLCLRHVVLPLAGLLGSLALAHEGHFDVTDLHVTEEKGERFLGMRVTYGEHDAPLSFSAALINDKEAILEMRRGGSYRLAERLVIDPGVHVFGTSLPLRVRLPDGLEPPRGRYVLTATLLFEPGFLVSHQVRVEGAGVPWSRAWQVSLVLGGLVVLGAGSWLVIKRRMKLQPVP